MKWSTRLARPVGVIDGPVLKTLADARAFLLTLRGARAGLPQWQHAARLLLEAAEDGDVSGVTRQLELALFLTLELELEPRDASKSIKMHKAPPPAKRRGRGRNRKTR